MMALLKSNLQSAMRALRKHAWNLILLAILIAPAIWPLFHRANAASPSFDCRKARGSDEIKICQEPTLADIDVLISKAFEHYEAEFRPKNDVGGAFITDRRACGSDMACIAAIQARALETYGGKSPWVDLFAQAMMGRKAASYAGSAYARTPNTKVGKCVKTRVQGITTRFGDPISYGNEDQGTSIEYQNGDHQVSYGREGLYGVKAGQGVILCLMSVLHDCPKGDTRGNLYLALNLETESQWELTDTQHMCGGA